MWLRFSSFCVLQYSARCWNRAWYLRRNIRTIASISCNADCSGCQGTGPAKLSVVDSILKIKAMIATVLILSKGQNDDPCIVYAYSTHYAILYCPQSHRGTGLRPSYDDQGSSQLELVLKDSI
jgi:hypothetical protein